MKKLLIAILLLSFPLLSGARSVIRPLPAEAAVTGSWTLTFTGDIMLDRNVWTTIIAHHNSLLPLLANVKSELTGNIVIGNLEGPFTNSTKHAVSGGSLSFTFEPYLAPQLKQAGFTTVSLANNHTLNQGQAGLQSTRTTLGMAGIFYFGDPANRHGYGMIQTVNGVRIAFIGYHGLADGLSTIIADVRQARTLADIVIVMPHEGIEYKLTPSSKQQVDYRRLIDAGADMIIGAHPHVVEPMELYKGKMIFYSLGNFLFDQYFSADTQQELLLHISGRGTAVTSVQLVPLQSNHSIISKAGASVRTGLLRRIAATSAVPQKIKTQILSGTIRF